MSNLVCVLLYAEAQTTPSSQVEEADVGQWSVQHCTSITHLLWARMLVKMMDAMT